MEYMEYMESKDGQDENFRFLNLYRITVNHGDIVHVLEDAFVPSLRCQEFSAMLGEVPHFLLREQAVDMTSAHGGNVTNAYQCRLPRLNEMDTNKYIIT